MPTSARGFDNRAVGLDPPVLPARSRGDVGIAPYANGKILPFIGGLALTFRCPLHTRRCGGTLSKQERAGDSRTRPCGKRGSARSDPVPPHTRQGFALPPSPRRGFFIRSGSPAALRQRTRREPSFTAIRAGFSVKWLLTPRGKPGVNTPSCSS